MHPGRSSRPRGPLDDDWLYADPMAIELAGGDDVGTPADWTAAADSGPARRRYRLLALVAMIALGAAAATAMSGPWHGRAAGTAVACPPGQAAGAGQAPPVAG